VVTLRRWPYCPNKKCLVPTSIFAYRLLFKVSRGSTQTSLLCRCCSLRNPARAKEM